MQILSISKTIALAGAAVGLAAAGAAFAAGPQAKATGDVFLGSPNQELNFSAFAAGGGMPAKGSVTYTNVDAGITYTAPVTCANVQGNTAVFTYTIPQGYPGISGLNILFKVVDGGTPGTNGDTVGFAVVSDPTVCPIDTAVTNYPVTGGNVVVH